MMKKRTYNTKANRGKLANEDPNGDPGPNSRATGAPNNRGKRKRATAASGGHAGLMPGTVVASNPFDDEQQHHHHHHHQIVSNGGIGMHGYHPMPHQHIPQPQGPLQTSYQQQPFQSMATHQAYPPPMHNMASISPGPPPPPMHTIPPQMASPSPYGPSGQMNPGQPPLPPPSSSASAYPTHPSPLSGQSIPPRPGSQPQRIPSHLGTPPLHMHPEQVPSAPSPHAPPPPTQNMYGYQPSSSFSPPAPPPPPPMNQLGGVQHPMGQQIGAPSPHQQPPQHPSMLHPTMSDSPAYDQPPQQNYCVECRRPFYPNDFRIMCRAGCESYYHQPCSGLTELACDMLMREANAEWACNRCICSDRKIPVVRTIVNQTNDCRAPPVQWA